MVAYAFARIRARFSPQSSDRAIGGRQTLRGVQRVGELLAGHEALDALLAKGRA